jgi:hypothetical protein
MSYVNITKYSKVTRVYMVSMKCKCRYVGAGALMQSYGTNNMAPTQNNKPLSLLKTIPHFQISKIASERTNIW